MTEQPVPRTRVVPGYLIAAREVVRVRLHNTCNDRDKGDHSRDLNANCNSLARWIVDDVLAVLARNSEPIPDDRHVFLNGKCCCGESEPIPDTPLSAHEATIIWREGAPEIMCECGQQFASETFAEHFWACLRSTGRR